MKFLGYDNQVRASVNADAWATQHYSIGERAVAAITARIIVEQQEVDLEQLSPTTRFIEDLDMRDPMEGVELVMAVEDEFGFKIPDADAEAINTVGALIAYLHRRVQGVAKPKS